MRKWTPRIALAFLTCLLTVVGMEAVLRLTGFRYYLSGHDLTRFHYKSDPEVGHDIDENGPHLVHRMPEEAFEYELWSNELGCFDLPYRGERDYALLVGDSFTEYLAPFQEMWGTRVDELLGHRVLKCGVGGSGTRQEHIKARRIIERVRIPPRLIVIGYYMNDLEDDYNFPGKTVVNGHLVTARQISDWTTGSLRLETREQLAEMVDQWERTCAPSTPPERFAVFRCFLRRHSIVFNAVKPFIWRSATPRLSSSQQEASYPLAFNRRRNIRGFAPPGKIT